MKAQKKGGATVISQSFNHSKIRSLRYFRARVNALRALPHTGTRVCWEI